MGAQKRAWIILWVILVLELVPFTLSVALSPPGVIGRLYRIDFAIWPAWAAALLIAGAYVLYAARAFPLIRERFLTINSMKVVAILFAIVTGTVEELYFRKFLMDWAAHHGLAGIGQVAMSAAVFGAAHGIWGIFARQWRMAIGAAAATGVLGALLAIVYLAAGRHVAPCIWAHMLINLAIEPWLILAAASGDSRASRPSRTLNR
jgi:hypothetical protein